MRLLVVEDDKDLNRQIVNALENAGYAVDKAFEPYFTTRDEEGGAGLGRAVVYGFVRQSGGDAHILSTPGKGTPVELSFPA